MKPNDTLLGKQHIGKDLRMQVFKLLYTTLSGLLLVILLFSYMGNMWLSDRICVDIAVLCGVVAVIYCIMDMSNRFVLLCFNVNYFLFLVSGLWLTLLEGGYPPAYLGANVRAASHTAHVLAISLLIVNLVFILMDKPPQALMDKQAKKFTKEEKKQEPLPKLVEQIILAMLILCLVSKLVGAVIQYQVTSASSYVDSYITGFEKPFLVWMPESIFYFVLCLWLCTNPKKKPLLLLLAWVLVIEVIILLSGDRAEPICTLLLLCYYIYRRSKNEEDFFQIKKWHVALALVMVPLLIIALQTVKHTRVHESVEVSADMLMEFVEDQGVSAGVISRAYVSRNTIKEIGGSSYTFGSLRNYLEQNMASRVLLGIEVVKQNTKAAAFSGDSLGSTIAYLWFPTSYFEGTGCGSSYIAEFFHDGGIGYLCFGSMALGLLLIYFVRVLQKSHNVFSMAFVLLILKDIIIVSRTSTFYWLTNAFTVQNLLVLALLLLITHLARNKDKEGRRRESRNLNHAYGG